MKKYLPMLAACSVVIPTALLIGLYAGKLFGSLSGVAGLIVILFIAQHSRRVSASKKLEQ